MDRDRVHLNRQIGDRQELLELGGKIEPAGMSDVVEGAHPERIADETQDRPALVPERGGKGAVDIRQGPAGGEALAEIRRGRGNARGQRPGAGRDETGTAVDARGFAGTSTPPAIAQGHTFTDEAIDGVATVVDGIEHRIEHRRVLVPDPATDPAHGLPLIWIPFWGSRSVGSRSIGSRAIGSRAIGSRSGAPVHWFPFRGGRPRNRSGR